MKSWTEVCQQLAVLSGRQHRWRLEIVKVVANPCNVVFELHDLVPKRIEHSVIIVTDVYE